MALKIFIVTLGILAIHSVVNVKAEKSPEEFLQLTDEAITGFKKEVEKLIAEENITCENHVEKCSKNGNIAGPFSFCELAMKPYLCDGRKDMNSLRETIKKIKEVLKTLMG